MECIVSENTTVLEFKHHIVKEAREQGIDYDLDPTMHFHNNDMIETGLLALKTVCMWKIRTSVIVNCICNASSSLLRAIIGF